MKFSANLGFLWNTISLPDAIRAAKAAGFDAVECHWPYETPSQSVVAALEETGFEMLGLNTLRGNPAAGDNGLSALANRIPEARAAIDQALAYAIEIKAQSIHVMAGFATGPEAHETFIGNLRYACRLAEAHGITILIEPLNRHDAPGYFLTTTDQAAAIIAEVGNDNLRLMFDCYHVQRMEGDVSHRLQDLQTIIGHIQFASVPTRGAPDQGELNYSHVFDVIDTLGWTAPLGAEYKPVGETNASLDWLRTLRGNVSSIT